MTEREGAQERAQRRGSAYSGEQSVHPAVAEQVHVVDRIGTGDHPTDQRRDLQVRVGTTRCGQGQVLGDQVAQAGPFGQPSDRIQARQADQVQVVECHGNVVRRLHLPSAPALILNRNFRQSQFSQITGAFA